MTGHELPLPDKCDFCGLQAHYVHVYIGHAQEIDQSFSALHRLKTEGIIDSVPRRRMTASIGAPTPDTTSFCAVNSSAWSNKQTSCRYWSLRIKDADLADYLAIYHTKKNQEVATILSVLAVCIMVVVAIIQLSI